MYDKEFYSVKEVAHILRLSPDRIYEYLRTGRLRGSRLAKNSAWRIPATELERLGASRSGTLDEKQVKTKSDKWSSLLDIAAQLQSSLSAIDPKHLGVYGVGPHSFGSTVIPQPKLRVWVEQGQVQVNLLVEEDSRFPLFMSQARVEFPQFSDFENCKDRLAELIGVCQSMRSEIKEGLERETGIKVFGEVIISAGPLYEAWRFVHEFALDNYSSGKQPDLEILQNDSKRYRLVPRDLPDYILAIGSQEEMERCKKVTISLTKQYAQDEQIGRIKVKALEVKRRSALFQTILSTVIEETAADSYPFADAP